MRPGAKLGMSNLAWAPADTPAALDRLAALGVQGIEAAPTRIAGWEDLTQGALIDYRRRATAAGLQIPSLQALFFGRPGDQLLGDAAAFGTMAEHTRRVAAIAGTLGAEVAVFGAPRNRLRGALPDAEAEGLAAARLQVLGDIAQAAGVVLALEPVPACYGADFLLHAADVRRLVRRCGHPGIRPHLDSACVTLAGDGLADEIAATGPGGTRPGEAGPGGGGDGLAHYHIAEPGLGPFDAPSCPHAAAGDALRQVGYTGWLVIEMREQPGGLAVVEAAIRLAQQAYGVPGTTRLC